MARSQLPCFQPSAKVFDQFLDLGAIQEMLGTETEAVPLVCFREQGPVAASYVHVE
jgi:hypothetical protein